MLKNRTISSILRYCKTKPRFLDIVTKTALFQNRTNQGHVIPRPYCTCTPDTDKYPSEPISSIFKKKFFQSLATTNLSFAGGRSRVYYASSCVIYSILACKSAKRFSSCSMWSTLGLLL